MSCTSNGEDMTASTDPASVRLKRSLGSIVGSLARLSVWAWAAFSVSIFAWLILAAFKTNRTVFQQLFALPEALSFENFAVAWDLLNLNRTFANTVIVVGLATAIALALAAPAAYALSRFGFKGVGFLTVAFAVGIGIPTQSILIPLFVGMAKAQLTDSLVGLTLIYIGISIPFAVFLLTAFFASLPKELEEASLIDGAGPIRTFWSVMLPLAQTGLITTAIFTAVGLWNEYLFALTFIIDDDKRTLSLTLLNTYGAMRFTSNWVGLFAAVVIIVGPIVVLYIFLSRRIIEGITLGSSK